MNIAFDTETKGFSKEIICGCIYQENGISTTAWTKEQIKQDLINIGTQNRKKGTPTNAYAHNLAYDFYRLFEITDPKIKWIKKESPMICEYYDNNERKGLPIITFLDTIGIFKGTGNHFLSLKTVGQITGEQKKELPKEISEKLFDEKKANELTKKEKQIIAEYCMQDCKAVIGAINYIKEGLAKEGVKINRIYTIGQIARNIFRKKVNQNEKWAITMYPSKETKQKDKRYQNKGQEYWKSPNGAFIHKAYRGGRVEAIQKTGTFKNVNNSDINSLYPYCATLIPFPDLRTESKQTDKPLKTKNLYSIINRIGVTECILKKKKEEIGSIPIKYQDKERHMIYPKQACTMIGTWTNLELKEWLKQGIIEIIDIRKSVSYSEIEDKSSPLKEFMEEYYKKRIEYPRLNWFYKAIMNHLIGKFAQKNNKEETIIITPTDGYKEIIEKQNEGYRIQAQDKDTYIMVKKEGKTESSHYIPIISAYVNAKGRLIMKEYLDFLGKRALYISTDGILYTGQPLGNSYEIGQFKTYTNKEPIRILGSQTYIDDKGIKYSGIDHSLTTKETIKKGEVYVRRMVTIKNAKNNEEAGTFINKKIDISNKEEKWRQQQEEIKEQELFIDQEEQKDKEAIQWYTERGYI